MRLGVCAAIHQGAALAAAGWDFIELSVAGDLMPETDDAGWAETRRAIDALSLPPEAFNSFVRTLKIVGPDADLEALRRYVDTALARAALVGGKVIVFGSGGARNVPDGFSREVALGQIRDFLDLCGDASVRTGVTVVIEPLCRAESNILNTVGEGAALARSIGRPCVRNLADTYHMEADSEPLSEILAHADTIAHVHTADTGREAPGTCHYDHVALFATLKAIDYDARVSVECHWRDFDAQIGPALAHLKAAQ